MLKAPQKPLKPNLSRTAFWDVDFDNLDYDNRRAFVIQKVMNDGLLQDFVEVVKFYGKDVVRQEIVKASYYRKDVINFLCFYFNLKPDDFVCYMRRQSFPQHWKF